MQLHHPSTKYDDLVLKCCNIYYTVLLILNYGCNPYVEFLGYAIFCSLSNYLILFPCN